MLTTLTVIRRVQIRRRGFIPMDACIEEGCENSRAGGKGWFCTRHQRYPVALHPPHPAFEGILNRRRLGYAACLSGDRLVHHFVSVTDTYGGALARRYMDASGLDVTSLEGMKFIFCVRCGSWGRVVV